jgi:hypothetical protein
MGRRSHRLFRNSAKPNIVSARAAQPNAQQGLNVVMLLTDGFGGFGGIAKFNRDSCRRLMAVPSWSGCTHCHVLFPSRSGKDSRKGGI